MSHCKNNERNYKVLMWRLSNIDPHFVIKPYPRRCNSQSSWVEMSREETDIGSIHLLNLDQRLVPCFYQRTFCEHLEIRGAPFCLNSSAGWFFFRHRRSLFFFKHFYVLFTIEFSGLIYLFYSSAGQRCFLLVRWVKVFLYSYQVGDCFL